VTARIEGSAVQAALAALPGGRHPVLHVARRRPAASAMQTVLIALLRFYKVAVSPMLGNRCRFYPSCSDYAREAIQYHGAARGTYLAARRICRCHPFSAGGIDLVPPPTSEKR
jgi:putative membrane protein insertion efficiency factor